MSLSYLNTARRISSKLIVSLLAKAASCFGYVLANKEIISDDQRVIKNYFARSHNKNALISYLVFPFYKKFDNHHSNNRECFLMAEILDELGYNVDVINWNNEKFRPSVIYDIVIDNHNLLDRLNDFFSEETCKILHATNAQCLYQNSVEYNRYYEFFLKSGIAIKPPRQIPIGNSARYADAISMFGNEFTKNTYGPYHSKVSSLPMSITGSTGELEGKDFTSAKTKFIWLNSHGAMLKGLDIIIDAFFIASELDLYICGNSNRDQEYIDAIKMDLAAAPNIKFLGWVDLEGEVFQDILTECAWVVGASFSEGGGGSILNCMAKGLIPIVSRSTSITLPSNTGFYIENNSAGSLVELLRTVSNLPSEELSKMSNNATTFIKNNHTTQHFKNNYKKFLQEQLAKKIS